MVTGRCRGLGRTAALLALTLALGPGVARAAWPEVVISPPTQSTAPMLEPSLGWSPALASSGENLLVVYLANIFDSKLVGRLIANDGTPIGLPFVIAPSPTRDQTPAVVFDGEVYIVSWLEGEGPYRTSYRRVTTTGDQPSATQLIDAGISGHMYHAAAAGETGVLFLNCELDDCRTRLLVGETLMAPQQIPLSGSVNHVSLAHSDGVWLAAIGHDDISFLQLDANGAPIEDLGRVVDGTEAKPVVAPVADGFVGAWTVANHIQMAHVDFDGVVSLAPAWTNALYRPQALLATESDLVLLATEFRTDCAGVACGLLDRAQRVDATLTPVGAALPFTGGFGDIATTASGAPLFVAADRPGHIDGARVELTNGGLTLSEPVVWSESAADQVGTLGAPAGDGWAVAWLQQLPAGDVGSRVRAAFLSSTGEPLGQPFDIGEPERRLVALDCSPGPCLIATDEASGFVTEPMNGDLHRVTPDGSIEQTPGDWYDNASLAGSPSGFVLLTVVAEGRALVARRLDASAQLLDETLLAPLVSPVLAPRPVPLEVARDGDDYVATWHDAGQIWSRRVPVQGPIPNEAPRVLFTDADGLDLDAGFQGSDWWVATSTAEYGSVFGAGMAPQPTSPRLTSLVGARGFAVATQNDSYDGFLLRLAPPGETLSDVAFFEDASPHLAVHADGRVLLSSSSYDSTWGAPVYRVNTRVVTIESAAGGEGGAAGEAGAASGAPGSGGAAGMDEGPTAAGGVESSAPDGDAAAPNDDDTRRSKISKGCGCRAAGTEKTSSSAWWLALATLLALRRRPAT